MQGAPQPFEAGGAEIERLEDPRSRVARTVEGPSKGKDKTAKQTNPTLIFEHFHHYEYSFVD